MDEHRDIYTKPTGKAEGAEALPAPEPAPSELRAATRRRTISSTIIMVLLLALAALYFFLQERKFTSDPLLDKLLGGTNSMGRDGLRAIPVASIPAASSDDFAASLEQSVRQSPPDIPPQKLAEVMAAVRLANDYLLNREWDSAETQIRKALALWPDMSTALRMLGVIYTQRGQFDQAILVLERALKTDPFSADTFNNLATAYMQRGQLERAEDLLLTAVQIRPESAVSHSNLGLLYVLWGRYDQAAEHLQTAVRIMPENPGARNNLGVSLLRLGRYEEAREHFRNLLSRQPARPEYYFNTAITYVLERNPEEALAWLRQGANRCSPVEAQRHLMDSDFDSLRGLPGFQALMKDLSEPRRGPPGLPTPAT